MTSMVAEDDGAVRIIGASQYLSRRWGFPKRHRGLYKCYPLTIDLICAVGGGGVGVSGLLLKDLFLFLLHLIYAFV